MDFFNQYSFKEINTNTLKRMSDNEYKIPLLKNNLEITLDNLSTGEKVIMYLILSKCLAIFNDIELLLIDELDAHLNPALLKIYYDILTQISTTIPVIVTTHNPVFVNLVSNENLFWMENGRVLPKTKQTKYKILNKLASGLFTVNDIIENICCLFDKETQYDAILLCEGMDDEMLLNMKIKDAFKSKKVALIDCKGAENITKFCELPFKTKNPNVKIICVFDNDGKGKKCHNELQEQFTDERYRNYFTLFISDTDNDKLEHVAKDDVKMSNFIHKLTTLIN